MPGSVEDFGIWKKKKNSWDLNSERESWDSSLEEGSRFLGSTKCTVRLLKKLCLSLLKSKNLKLKKVNKSFVLEQISSVFRIPICVWTLWTFYACEYLGRIFGRGYTTQWDQMTGKHLPQNSHWSSSSVGFLKPNIISVIKFIKTGSLSRNTQYLSEVTVIVTISSKKYWPKMPNSAVGRLTVIWGLCKGCSCNSQVFYFGGEQI